MKREIDVNIETKLCIETMEDWISVKLGEVHDMYSLDYKNILGENIIKWLSGVKAFGNAIEIYLNDKKEATRYVDRKLKELGLIGKPQLTIIDGGKTSE